VTYKEPESAVHHLKMAKAYLDDADEIAKKEDKPNKFASEAEIKALTQAAEHLNKARAIDPNEVLWIEEGKDKEKVKLDQDYINGRVLLKEGIAHLNAALDISQYRNIDGTSDRRHYNEGTARLQQACAALEQALTYRPYSDDVLDKLATTYRRLGDTQNYRRILERHVEISPDNMGLHKQIEELNASPQPTPLLRRAGFSISAPTIFSGMLVLGIALIILGIATKTFNPAGWGIVFLLVSGAGFWLYENVF